MSRLATSLLAACLVVSATGPALASHYPLEGVPFIPEKDRKALEAAKIQDTKELLDALLTVQARKSMAEKTGIAAETLLEYARLCDLLRLRGVGPKMARLLVLCGVTGTQALGKEAAETLLEKMKAVNKVHMVSELVPQVETLADWIQQARQLEVVVKDN